MIVPPLPVVRPAPVAAAAAESPTASAPLPAVYGYTPEQRVGTERQESGKLSSRRQTGRGGGQTETERFAETIRVGGLICPALQRKDDKELAGGRRCFEHIFPWHIKEKVRAIEATTIEEKYSSSGRGQEKFNITVMNIPTMSIKLELYHYDPICCQ